MKRYSFWLKRYSLMMLTVLLLALLVHVFAVSAADNARSVIEQSDRATKSRTERTTFRMELLDAKGNVEQTRTSDFYFQRKESEERTLQKFSAPPVLHGSGLLIVDRGKPVNDIWIYLPTSRSLRRIAGAEKSNWYMGTEFAYEDFEDYRIPFYTFATLHQAECGAEERCSLIEATPATPDEKDASGYGRKTYWIGENTLYPRRIDYYDKSGRHVKTVAASGVHRVGNYWRPKQVVMQNLESGRSTRITILSQALDESLSEYQVSERFLRQD